MQAPLYNIGDILYIKESAAIGFLEAVRISGVYQHTQENWIYTVEARAASPRPAAIGGDRILHVNNAVLYFSESELISYCEALTLAESNVSNRLVQLQQLRASHCPQDEVTGTG